MPHRFNGALASLLARKAIGAELDFAGRRLRDASAHSQANQLVDIGRHGPGESPDFGLEPGLENQTDGLRVVGRDTRETRLDPPHAELIEFPGDFELLPGVEHHPDGLLAVAQGGVIETHRSRTLYAGAGVQLAHPDARIRSARIHVQWVQPAGPGRGLPPR